MLGGGATGLETVECIAEKYPVKKIGIISRIETPSTNSRCSLCDIFPCDQNT